MISLWSFYSYLFLCYLLYFFQAIDSWGFRIDKYLYYSTQFLAVSQSLMRLNGNFVAYTDSILISRKSNIRRLPFRSHISIYKCQIFVRKKSSFNLTILANKTYVVIGQTVKLLWWII